MAVSTISAVIGSVEPVPPGGRKIAHQGIDFSVTEAFRYALQPLTLIWRQGIADWVEAQRVKGLFSDVGDRR